MKFTDIPPQCRACSHLSILMEAKATIKESILKYGVKHGHIYMIPMSEIEKMPKAFPVILDSMSHCKTTSGNHNYGWGFTSHYIDLVSVGEPSHVGCRKSLCYITTVSNNRRKDLKGNVFNNNGKCSSFSKTVKRFDMSKKIL